MFYYIRTVMSLISVTDIIIYHKRNTYSRFASYSEVLDSELLENLEEMLIVIANS